MQKRFEKVIEKLKSEELDVFYCRNVSDIRWMTGFREVFDSERAHMAAVCPKFATIHTDPRYFEAMNRAAKKISGSLWEISEENCKHEKFFSDKLSEAFLGKQIRICIEPDLPLNEYKALVSALDSCSFEYELVDSFSPLKSLRAIKDEEEIFCLRKAQQIADEAFASLLDWIKVGVSEIELASELEYRMRAKGAGGLAFPTIAASGPNGANPHSIPGQRRLEKGDFVVIDFGAKYFDYCSDMTRTVSIGQPCDELLKIYDLTLEAHERCKDFIALGVEYTAVHNLASQIIADGGYAGKFNHGLGHGVGIDVHEDPCFNTRFKGKIQEGNVVTVEPGIYLPGIGGVRIEDFGVVTKGGFESFASTTHELIVL